MRFLTLVIVSSTLVAIAGAAPFSENFENAEVGKLPSGFTAYAGAFKVNEEMGRKFLELPGAPLDTFGVLFGPALQSADTAANRISASGKFYATSVKRKAPAFGISLGGVGGYRLQVSAAKGALEVFKGDEARANAPFQWASGTWTSLRIQLRQSGGKWVIEGKAWPADAPEPPQSTIIYEAPDAPPPGKAAIWGNPFSGTPIRYDDLSVDLGEPASKGR
jgi:hypothetical protein